jgi:hypothetical protein
MMERPMAVTDAQAIGRARIMHHEVEDIAVDQR